ncbi:MAG: hypothetical protein ACRDLK_11755 [Gaiellaceae bacterium]
MHERDAVTTARPASTPVAVQAPRAPTLRERLATIVPLAIFVAATTHWMTWSEPIRQVFAGDVLHYEKIAQAAPHFTWPQITGHISMWPVHYLVGIVAWVTHVPLHVVYYIASIAVLALLVATIDRILLELGVGRTAYALAMAAAMLNPYVFRYLALAPGMINDAVFDTCVALAVLALLQRRTRLLVTVLVVAALARGLSAPPVQLAAAIWLLFDRGLPVARRWIAAGEAIALPLAAFGLAYWVGTTTPGHAEVVKNCCSVTGLTVLGDIAHLPGSAHAIALHVARTAIGIAMPLAVLCAAAVVALWQQARPAPALHWWLLLVAAALVAQPLLLNTSWDVGASPRLASYAVAPLAAAAALLLERLEPLDRRTAGLCVALFAAASLNHRFASVGAKTAGEFAALAFASGAAVFLVLVGPTILRTQRDDAPAKLAERSS